jgi:hypothetical protein
MLVGCDAPVVRVKVTRLSKEAVVKSSASLGSTRSVAVMENDGVIIQKP